MTDDLGRSIDAREDNGQEAGPDTHVPDAQASDTQIPDSQMPDSQMPGADGGDTVSGAGGAETLVGQAVTTVTEPAAGETVTIVAEAGQRYVVDFDPTLAQVRVQGNNLVLQFPDGGQIVFQGLGNFANSANPPIFDIAGQPVSGAIIFAQAIDLGEAPFVTAAEPEILDSGLNLYDDNLGSLINLLNPQGVIPPVELQFGLIDLFPRIVDLGAGTNPPVDFDVDVTAQSFETLPFTFAPGLGIPVFTGTVGEQFVFMADEGSDGIFKISLDGKRVTQVVSEEEIAAAIGLDEFDARQVDLNEKGVKVDAAGNLFFTVDGGSMPFGDGGEGSIEIDSHFVLVKLAATGDIAIVASTVDVIAATGDTPFGGDEIFDPEDLVIGPDGSLFILDDASDSANRIIRIDDPLGTPTISVVATAAQIEADLEAALSSGGEGGEGGEGGSIDIDINFDVGIVISPDGTTLYVPVGDEGSGRNLQGVVAVDVATGAASLLTPLDNPFQSLSEFATIAPNGDIIVADEGSDILYRVDAVTGEISIFLSAEDIAKANGEGSDLDGGFAFDRDGNFYLADDDSDSLLMWPSFDPATGEVVRGAGMVLVDENRLEDAANGRSIDLDAGLTIGFMPLPADQFVVTYSGQKDDFYGDLFTVVRTQQNDSGSLDIFARFVSADGTPVGDECQVNSFDFSGATDLLPDVAALRGGGFVVTWTTVLGDLGGDDFDAALGGFGDIGGIGLGGIEGVVVLSRVFDGSGVPLGPEFPVASFESPGDGIQLISKVAGLENGSFVVTWTDLREPEGGESLDSDLGAAINIFARQYTPSGVPMGPEFQVNALPGIQAISDVAALDDGGFAVVFTAIDTGGDGGEGGIQDLFDAIDVMVRVYDADGTPRGDTEALITTVPDGLQALVKVTGLAGGGFLATWTDVNQDASGPEDGINVLGRVFGADGAPAGDEFTIASGPAGIELLSSAVALPGGKFFVSWTEISTIDDGEGGEGGGQTAVDIFGRVFGADGTPVGPEFPISQGLDLDSFGVLSTQAALGGTVLVTWTELGEGGLNVIGRLYGVDGAATGDAIALGDAFAINEETDPALLSSVAALRTSFQGGFLYEFQVGETEIVLDNIHGTDVEDGVTTQFTITNLPTDQNGDPSGLLLIDRGDDNVVEEIYGDGFSPLPSDGIQVQTGDSVFYLLPFGSFDVRPELVTFNYFTVDSDGLDSLGDGPATVSIDFPDAEPNLIFVSEGASVDEDDIVPMDGAEGAGGAVGQEPGSDFLGQFLADDEGAFGPPLDPPPSDAPPVATGTVFADFGSDRPGSIVFSEANLTALDALGLTTSTFKDDDGNDLELKYALGGNGRTLIGYVDIGDLPGQFDQVEGLEDAADSVVFVATLAPSSANNGEFTYTFKLHGSINHVAPEEVALFGDDSEAPAGGEGIGETPLDLPFEFIVSDIDGDTVTGTFNISVVDDVPAIAPVAFDGGEGFHQPTDLSVQEAEIVDGGEGVMPDTATTTATIVFGADGPEATQEDSPLNFGNPVALALTGIKALAEGPGDSVSDPEIPYSLVDGDGLPQLTSGGIPVQFRMEGPTKIVGFVEAPANGGDEIVVLFDDGFAAGERIVFEAFLDVREGDLFGTDEAKFTFNLLGPLDHPDDAAVDGAEGGPGVGQTGSDDQIAFAFTVTVLDDDGDTDTLNLTVRVDDDGPVQILKTLATDAVEEEQNPVPGGNEDTDDAQGLDDDTSISSRDGPPTEDFDVTTNVSTGSLAAAVSFGADEPGSFSLSGEIGDLPELMSRGDLISYDVTGNRLTAYVDSGADGAEGSLSGALDEFDRVVFTLDLSGEQNATYTFTLNDVLDHHPVDLADNAEGVLAIDFSSIVVATDFDGDSIVLAPETFVINAIDDVPVIDDGTAAVAHDETPGVDDDADDVDLGSEPLPDSIAALGLTPIGAAQSAAGQVAYSFGADGPGQVSLSDANGNPLNGIDSGLDRSSDGKSIFLFTDAADPRLVLGRALLSFETADVDGGAAAESIVVAGHGLATGQRVTYSFIGNGVAGLTNAGVYFAIVLDANTIQLAESEADALAGNAIDLTPPPVDADAVHFLDPAGDPSGNIALAVYLDTNGAGAADDTLWVAQFDAIEHPIPGDGAEGSHDEGVSIEDTVFLTVSDGDGDSVTAENALTVTIQDDGPSAPDALVVNDETFGLGDDTPSDDVDLDRPADLPIDIDDIIDLAGADPINISKKAIAFDYGADGPGGIALDPVVDGTDSGLIDTETGAPIFLYNGLDGRIVGVAIDDDGIDPTGLGLDEAVFEFGFDVAFVGTLGGPAAPTGPDNASSADLFFVQFRAIQHDNPFDPDEAGPEGQPQQVTDTITFEGLAAGTIVSQVFGDRGFGPILVNGVNPRLPDSPNEAVIFDSANPTGGDTDLRTPGSGPGNGTPLGNILIVADNLTDANGDGLVDVPNDASGGGETLSFDFSALGAVTMNSITIVDIESAETSFVTLFGAAGQIGLPIMLPVVGDNGVAAVDIGGVENVTRMEVALNGSGAVDNIVFTHDVTFVDESLTLAYTVTDADGDTVPGSATITIEDDGPDAVDDAAVYLASDGFEFGVVVDNDSFGVDGPAADGEVRTFAYTGDDGFGDPAALTVPAGLTATTFAGGELTVDDDGFWDYLAPEFVSGDTLVAMGLDADAAGFVDDFHYTIQDGDGDRDTGVQHIRVVLDESRAQFGDQLADGTEDTLMGGETSDFLSGRGGSDTLIGNAGGDLLFGDDGDDILIGGDGNDLMFGDDGADTFEFSLSGNEGDDTIGDFSVSEGDVLSFTDVVDVTGTSAGIDIDDAVASFSKTGTTVNVELHSGTTIAFIDIDNAITNLADLDNHSMINGAMNGVA